MSSEVISWDVYEDLLTDGSFVYDVRGTSDECRVTFHCASEEAAELLVETLRSVEITGATAETLK